MESHNEHPEIPLEGTRRSFLGVLLGLAAAFVCALLGIPVLRYIFYPLTAKSSDSGWAAVGSVANFSNIQAPLRRTIELKQRDGWQETDTQPIIYIINKGGKIQALSAICPHLGCTVPWDAAQNKFVCPCHGGVFGPDGAYISGPPPRSLDFLQTKVSSGKLMVKYQYFRPDVRNKEVTS
ncbi:MAG TPA: ubiquinol-cytochrome c reductase iron-sulfur subunit [Candidatus Dormibacteraeota bacterium]|nr:ubiquinol-cytochrome c reductase iron-sulfur subunit [Candidatus Dormibacteraeota bacterium]